MSDRNTLDYVFPRIYPILPVVGPADVTLSEKDCPVERGLVADLLILYAFDLDSHFELVANGDLARLGVNREELHARSIQNLRALDLEIRSHAGDRCLMLAAGGNFEATLLLLPELWDAIHPMVKGEIVVSVPARDILYFTGDAEPENLAELRRWTSSMLEKADKPLSRAFLLRDGDGWAEYAGFAG